MLLSIVSGGLVLALLAGLVWWLRRTAGLGMRAGRHIQVVESVALGPSHWLHLVRVGGRNLVIASSGGGCELISELTLSELTPPPEVRP